MPGFKVAPRNDGNHIAIPQKVVYTYTWDVSRLVSKDVRNTPLIYVKETGLPAFVIEGESYKTGHASYEFAKSIKWEDIKFSFYDTDGLGEVLDDLRKKVWTPEAGIRIADEYMADTVIQVYYADGSEAYSWILNNSWVKATNFSKLTYESSGINNATVTIGYTWAKFQR